MTAIEGKVVAITGASSGIGEATALLVDHAGLLESALERICGRDGRRSIVILKSQTNVIHTSFLRKPRQC
jgi:NAD(P)-dependent dehydrogenase (short-subunit alcohol dehydrogenase family)